MKVKYYKGDIISSIETNITREEIVTNQEKFEKIFNHFSKEFIKEQYYNADKLIDYAKDKNINIGNDFVLFKHKEGIAMCNIYSNYSDEGVNIEPAIDIYVSKFINGWSFNKGCFADVYTNISNSNNKLWFLTRDTLLLHNLFLIWVIEKVEENYNNDNLDFNTKNNFSFSNLNSQFELEININRREKINGIKVKGISAKEYIYYNNFTKYLNSDNDIFKMCLFFKKPYKQIKRYIERIAN